MVNIPVLDDGSFCIEEQNTIAKKYELIEKVKVQSKYYLDTMKNCTVNIRLCDNIPTKEVNLDDIIDFKLSKTNNSKFTKKTVNDNKGNIPVFGATKFHGKPTYGYIVDNVMDVKYFEDCLTWNIDGSLGCFYRKGEFSLSEKVIPLYLFPQYVERIDLSFLAYQLLIKAYEHGFNREYKPNTSKLKELVIEIPVNSDGEYDILIQQQLAKKYRYIEEQRNKTIDFLKRIIEVQVKI